MTKRAYAVGAEDFKNRYRESNPFEMFSNDNNPFEAETFDAQEWERGFKDARHISRIRHHVTREAYAIISPEWGDLRVVTETISDKPEEAWKKACVCHDISLYSGYSEFPLPGGTKGKVSSLRSNGYRLGKVRLEIVEWLDHPEESK